MFGIESACAMTSALRHTVEENGVRRARRQVPWGN